MVAGLSIESQWEELVGVLRETRVFIAREDADFSWSGWEGQTEALSDLDAIIDLARHRNLDVSAMSYFYAPTGRLQEVSLSSGWADEFLALADRFDVASSGL